MATTKVGRDEFWPFPMLGSPYGTEIEVDASTLRRWKKVIADFEAVADEIFETLAEQTGKGKDG